MISPIITFIIGDIVLQQFSKLPSLLFMLGLGFFILIFSLICFILRKKYTYALNLILIFLSFYLGFLWSFYFGIDFLHKKIPNELEGKTLHIEGKIDSIPNKQKYQTSFIFKIKKIDKLNMNGRVKLSWRQPSNNLKVGEQWRLTVRLKKIHTQMNPGGFNYENYAFQEGIIASGYVINHEENIFEKKSSLSLTEFRQNIKEKIEKCLPHSDTSPWITALTIGERVDVASESWEVLRNTGTNHLMAIAGLHIGFLSGFVLLFVSFLWRKSLWLVLKMPAKQAGVIASLISAFIYSALAGFSIPTIRACIMLSLFLSLFLMRRKTSVWYVWSIAIFFVVAVNPANVLSESFWLSFGTVALIIYAMSGRIKPKGIWWKWGRIQWVIAIGLLPLSIGLFQQFSMLAFFANAIAIPWMGLLILPFIFLGNIAFLFSEKIAGIFLTLADQSLHYLWGILTSLSHQKWSVYYESIPNEWLIILGCFGVLILFFPKGMPGKGFGAFILLPLLYYQVPQPKFGEIRFTLLDVGQGLSAVVQTQHHLLVYDTGAKLSDNYDMGMNVVVPFLRTLSTKKIDSLVISHSDNDHSGGAGAIIKNFPVTMIQTSTPELFPFSYTHTCVANQKWTWDGVDFEFLYPTFDNLGKDNDSSCVLKVTSNNKSILLTGDIEKYAEKFLVEHSLTSLKSNILIAPHHGSLTSGVNSFIEAVDPKYVLFSTGYRNRYHLPNPRIIEKYTLHKSQLFNTVESGAIEINMKKEGGLTIQSFRKNHMRYWMT